MGIRTRIWRLMCKPTGLWIADMTDEIDAKERGGDIDEVMRDATRDPKMGTRGRAGEVRLEQIKDEQKRRAAEAKG